MRSVRSECSFGVAVIGACLLTLFPGGCRRDAADKSADPDAIGQAPIPAFSTEVTAVLWRRIELVEQLAAEKLLVDTVRKANRENVSMSEAEIQRRDTEWQKAENASDLFRPFGENECATRLGEFRNANRGFAEIFATDARGFIVAATNPTTDYVQSDEPWWQRAYNEGKGESHHGPLEYDKSASSESISLNVPVLDPDSGKAIGVIKAVCDIMAIKREL